MTTDQTPVTGPDRPRWTSWRIAALSAAVLAGGLVVVGAVGAATGDTPAQAVSAPPAPTVTSTTERPIPATTAPQETTTTAAPSTTTAAPTTTRPPATTTTLSPTYEWVARNREELVDGLEALSRASDEIVDASEGGSTVRMMGACAGVVVDLGRYERSFPALLAGSPDPSITGPVGEMFDATLATAEACQVLDVDGMLAGAARVKAVGPRMTAANARLGEVLRAG